MNIPSGPLGLMVAYLENGQKVYIHAPQPNPEATMNEFVPNIDNRKPMLYNMLPNPLPIHNTYAPLMVTSEEDAAQEEMEEERILSQAVDPKIVEGHIEAEFPRFGMSSDLGRKRRVISPGLSPNQANKKSFELRNPQHKDYPVNITQEEPIEMKIQLQMDIAMAGQRIPSDKILEISLREMLQDQDVLISDHQPILIHLNQSNSSQNTTTKKKRFIIRKADWFEFKKEMETTAVNLPVTDSNSIEEKVAIFQENILGIAQQFIPMSN
ncbi:hypothetical protein QYM36_012364, partial [Artemia franciscana]